MIQNNFKHIIYSVLLLAWLIVYALFHRYDIKNINGKAYLIDHLNGDTYYLSGDKRIKVKDYGPWLKYDNPNNN